MLLVEFTLLCYLFFREECQPVCCFWTSSQYQHRYIWLRYSCIEKQLKEPAVLSLVLLNAFFWCWFVSVYCAVPLTNDVHVHSNMPTLQLFNLAKITFLLIHVLYNYIILISIDSAKFSVHWQITCVQHLFATFEHMYRGSWDSDAQNNQVFCLLSLQRSALSVAANCCHSIGVGDFHLVADSIPILSGRLQHQVTQKTHRAAINVVNSVLPKSVTSFN